MSKGKKESEETAVAVKPLGQLTLADTKSGPDHGTATGEDVRDALTGEPRLQNIKVVHQGGVFSMPGDETVKEFTAIIMANTQRNAKFPKAFDDVGEGDDNKPLCFSHDGTNIADDVGEREGTERQATSCAECKLNRNARDRSARNHAFEELNRKQTCNNYVSLVVQLFDDAGTLLDMGYRLDLSNSSFKNWNDYVQGIGTRGRFKPRQVVTKFTLAKESGASGVFSRVKFEKIGAVPEPLWDAIDQRHEGYMALLRRSGFAQEHQGSDAREAAEAAKTATESAGGDAGL